MGRRTFGPFLELLGLGLGLGMALCRNLAEQFLDAEAAGSAVATPGPRSKGADT